MEKSEALENCPADRPLAHPLAFNKLRTLPAPSCPNRWLKYEEGLEA